MLGFSFGEILFLGALALIVIGPKQLPEVARNVGRMLNELKRVTEGFTSDLKRQAQVDFDLKNPMKPPTMPKAPPPPQAAPEKKEDEVKPS